MIFGRSGGLFIASPPPKVKNFIRASFHFSTSGCGLFTAIPNANAITKQLRITNEQLRRQLRMNNYGDNYNFLICTMKMVEILVLRILKFRICDLDTGIWNLEFRIWILEFRICHLKVSKHNLCLRLPNHFC